jgi:hypothetical protein
MSTANAHQFGPPRAGTRTPTPRPTVSDLARYNMQHPHESALLLDVFEVWPMWDSDLVAFHRRHIDSRKGRAARYELRRRGVL